MPKETTQTRSVALGFWLLSGLWCALFFSLSGCKLPTYVLPAFPFLTLALGDFIARQGHVCRRHVFFQVGERNVLLAFIPDATLKGDILPSHGAKGSGHFALGIATDEIGAWRQKLQENGIAIEKEVQWPQGGKSLYFRDPAGNLVELITPRIWGLPSGW